MILGGDKFNLSPFFIIIEKIILLFLRSKFTILKFKIKL